MCTHLYRRFPILLCISIVSLFGLLLGTVVAQDEPIRIGLITKTETNPFFVKMREGAQAKANELGVELLFAAGAFDGDNEAQLTAIENMLAARDLDCAERHHGDRAEHPSGA